MGHPPKAKPKRKSQKNTDKKQSERFIEAARASGADESGKAFRALMDQIVPRKVRRQKEE
jgi:hypothetical protein